MSTKRRGRGQGHARTVPPLSSARRTDNYRRQNGTDQLTPRQQRQVDRMARRTRYRIMGH